MRKLFTATGVLALVALGACSNRPPAPDTQMRAPSPGSSSAMPESANSRPAGSAINAPLAPATGNVGTTRTY